MGEITWTWTVSRVTDPDPAVNGHWQVATGTTVEDEPAGLTGQPATVGLGVVTDDSGRQHLCAGR